MAAREKHITYWEKSTTIIAQQGSTPELLWFSLFISRYCMQLQGYWGPQGLMGVLYLRVQDSHNSHFSSQSSGHSKGTKTHHFLILWGIQMSKPKPPFIDKVPNGLADRLKDNSSPAGLSRLPAHFDEGGQDQGLSRQDKT